MVIVLTKKAFGTEAKEGRKMIWETYGPGTLGDLEKNSKFIKRKGF